MAGARPRYRHLSRTSAHRKALLRNLVTSLVVHESIHTTYAKAKEAQRVAEHLITLAKRNTNASRTKAMGYLHTPHLHLPKLFGPLRERYAERPGGYTRVLRTEPKNSYDQAPSAILELVDGPRDMRWHLTAAAVARERALRGDKSDPAAWITTDSGGKEGPVTKGLREITAKNVKKVTRYRKDGVREFEALVERMRNLGFGDAKKAA